MSNIVSPGPSLHKSGNAPHLEEEGLFSKGKGRIMFAQSGIGTFEFEFDQSLDTKGSHIVSNSHNAMFAVSPNAIAWNASEHIRARIASKSKWVPQQA